MIKIISTLLVVLFSTNSIASGSYSGTFLRKEAEVPMYDATPRNVLYRFGESGYLALKDNKWDGQVLVDPSVGVVGIYHTAHIDLVTGSLTMEPDKYLSGILIFTSDKSLRDPNGKDTYKPGEFVKGFIKDESKPERYSEGIVLDKSKQGDKSRFVFQRYDRPLTPSDQIIQVQIKWLRDNGM